MRMAVICWGLALDARALVQAIGSLLSGVGVYWLVAALALAFYAWQRRRGLVLTAVNAALPWLVLRALGLVLLLLIPCLAPSADAALGLVVAVALALLLRLRSWQRGLCLAVVALGGAAQALSVGCRVPPGLAVGVGLAIAGLVAYRLARRWLLARGLWQRGAAPLNEWMARQARIRVTPTMRAVLEARLRQHLGFTTESVEPLGVGGVHASMPVVVSGHDASGRRRRYLAKIVSSQHWQVSLAGELLHQVENWRRGKWRRVLWPSLRALVEHEHYMLLFLADAGVPVPRPRGLYRLERNAYALVSDYLEDARPLRDAGEVSLQFVRRALQALRRMRDLDCAHNDVKDSNILLLPGDGVAFVDAAMAASVAGPKRLAQDLADMLVCLALHHDRAAVVAAAREIIGEEGLRRARHYLHHRLLNPEMQKYAPVDLPHELRRLVRKE
ncbi:MAG: hypothetical protein QME94_02855 [Anaerolineae bacterium]|nr:hypothetical protein [Anaerolineae bacterium]